MNKSLILRLIRLIVDNKQESPKEKRKPKWVNQEGKRGNIYDLSCEDL